MLLPYWFKYKTILFRGFFKPIIRDFTFEDIFFLILNMIKKKKFSVGKNMIYRKFRYYNLMSNISIQL